MKGLFDLFSTHVLAMHVSFKSCSWLEEMLRSLGFQTCLECYVSYTIIMAAIHFQIEKQMSTFCTFCLALLCYSLWGRIFSFGNNLLWGPKQTVLMATALNKSDLNKHLHKSNSVSTKYQIKLASLLNLCFLFESTIQTL